jgi:predicted transcriptional regulator
MMHDSDNAPTIPGLTTEIVAAYVGHHSIATTDFGRLIATIGQELAGLGQEPEQPTKVEPAVPVRRSVQPDHLVCLVCGKPFKSLRRHLRTSHDLTADSYRAMFQLARDYPMVAAASSARRAAIARRSGLGQRRPPEPAPVAQAEPVLKPARGRRAVKRAEPIPA